jgi:hypothetical protein
MGDLGVVIVDLGPYQPAGSDAVRRLLPAQPARHQRPAGAWPPLPGAAPRIMRLA